MSADLTGLISSANTIANTATSSSQLNVNQQGSDYVFSDYEQANKYSAQVMTNQKQMSDIVNTELTRLTQKKQSIDNAISTKERVTVLNDSYRLRYLEYTKMLGVIILALVCFLLLFIGGKYVPFIPSIVIDIIYIFLFVGTCIVLFNIYAGIQRRNKLYFDRLNLEPPNKQTPDQVAANKKAAGLSGNLLGSISGCIGKDCCSDGTYWDIESARCLSGTGPDEESFTTLAYPKAGQSAFSPAANSPNEFTEYTIIRR
jgi:hypothetical protein